MTIKWYSIEITKKEFDVLRFFLKAKGSYYELSECHNLVHVDAYLFENEVQEFNAFMDAIVDLEKSVEN